ncbi:GNAT family N-acetyltransferase [Aurantibacter crassamenti]|uniref:GNAT family N-acetyltransferase n=1 Tax=Aurantibacter crassamenti TaxID=1837375 RepID=UPI00293D92EA|nr:GNAT family N-acetyltransferase [Aurantibacter crassamenti]
MIVQFQEYGIDSIHEKYAWRICDLMVTNAERFKRYFPKTLEQNRTPDLSKYFVEKKLKQFNKKEEFLFVLKEIKDRKVIGLVYIKEIDWITKQAELAYCIDYKYNGKGITTEAVKYLSNFALKNLELLSLQIIVHESNLASIKVAEKCGYIWTKKLPKEHTTPNEKPLDMELYELYK